MRKVFVIDDDREILNAVKLVLESDHYDVRVTTMWEEIDQTIKDFGPDMILIDVNLHGADGRDICKKMRQIEEWRHIPVLLFSARRDLLVEYRKCGANGYISKPFDVGELLTLVKSHLPAA